MHREITRWIWLALFAVVFVVNATCVLIAPANAAEEPAADADEQRFIRLRRDDDGEPIALETSITRYSKPAAGVEGPTVDLIGAVHIADKSYFEQLNRAFADYDVVLYELVAPKDAVPQPGQRSVHPVSALQVGMKNMLELEFQLDHIDYTAENMRHADFTPDEFARSMKDRGESPLKLLFRMLGQSIAQQAESTSRTTDAQMLAALFSRDRAHKLKCIMAEQFQDMKTTAALFEGPDGSTILTERNKRAMTELKDAIRTGSKRIAIFYGAAHLPDMQTRLREEHGFELQSERWLAAWALAE